MTKVAVNPLAGPGSVLEKLLAQPIEWKLHWLLRIGVFLEFCGHGACGMNTKAGWLPYFQVFGIPESMAWKLMPLVGLMDIVLGWIALLSPRRALLLYMAIWGTFTALLRPAAGEGGWEFIERAYNYGVPLLFLLLHRFGHDRKSWFEPLQTVPTLSPGRAQMLLGILRVVLALLLIGHGGFGAFMAKRNLLGLYQSAGLGSFGWSLESVRMGLGCFEIGLGFTALFARRPAFFTFLFAWKIATESLYLVAGAKLACWEFIERGGSYVAPIAALCLVLFLQSSRRKASDRGYRSLIRSTAE